MPPDTESLSLEWSSDNPQASNHRFGRTQFDKLELKASPPPRARRYQPIDREFVGHLANWSC